MASGRTAQAGQVVGEGTELADPVEAALHWQRAGAQALHLVDLDAAFARGSNRALIAEVVGLLDIDVQVSGGVWDDSSLFAALETGCRRVNVSAAALTDLAWCTRVASTYGDRVAIGLDVRDGVLAARGRPGAGPAVSDVLDRLDAAGCARYVVTDVTRDGAMRGPNVELLLDVCARTDRPVIASGGVSTLDDLRLLASLVPRGIEAAIVGTALYAGAFTLPEALSAVSTSPEDAGF